MATTSSDGSGVRRHRTPDDEDGWMRAVVQDRYGSAGVLRTTRIERPTPAARQVLVEVHAAGVDRGTWHLMTGRPRLVRLMGFGLRRPKTRVPGRDVAGVVVAVGSAVTRFTPGDEVFGVAPGSFAEYAVGHEDRLAPKPARLSTTEAAAVPVSGLTALQALRDAGRVRAGQHVLVLGASGGVGSFAVQLAKAFGAEVTGVCSTAKVAFVRSLGADHVVDYTREDATAAPSRYDLVLDIGGNTPLTRLRRCLRPAGTLVIVGGEDGGDWTGGFGRQLRAVALSPFLKQRLTALVAREHHRDLEELARLVDEGRLSPHVDAAHPLERAAEALRRLEAGEVRGKCVIAL